MNPPTVSICIPSYNAEPFIGDTLRSVLGQTYTDFEVIVVDDASDDATVSVVESFRTDPRLTVHRNAKRLGAAANWNRAISLARGRYVKLLCSDDILVPDSVERSVAVLDREPEVAFVGGRRDVIDARGRVLFRARGGGGMRGRVDGREAIRRTLRLATTPFGEPSFVLVRRSVLEHVGLFSDHYGYVLDVHLWARLARAHDCYVIADATLGSFRLSGTSLSAQMAKRQGHEARRLFRRIAEDPAFGVSEPLLALALAKTHVLSRARRLAFMWSTRRAGRA